MIELINNFTTEIIKKNDTITVLYCNGPLTGTCEYVHIQLNNRFKQQGWMLINTDMGDVIEFIHANMPLKAEDLQEVNKLIRDHSLHCVSVYHT